MKQRLKIIIPMIIIMLICAAGAVVACVLLLGKDDSGGFDHLEVPGGNSADGDFKIFLYRDKLETNSMDEEEGLVRRTDTTRVDFTAARNENIFGLSGDTVIVPGSMYSADMVLENASSANSAAYWLNIVVTQGSVLGEQLKYTVSVDGKTVDSGNLNGNAEIGSDRNVLAFIPAGKSSKFSVKIEFTGSEGNNTVQGESLFFDLAVKAVMA